MPVTMEEQTNSGEGIFTDYGTRKLQLLFSIPIKHMCSTQSNSEMTLSASLASNLLFLLVCYQPLKCSSQPILHHKKYKWITYEAVNFGFGFPSIFNLSLHLLSTMKQRTLRAISINANPMIPLTVHVSTEHQGRDKVVVVDSAIISMLLSAMYYKEYYTGCILLCKQYYYVSLIR